MTKPAPNPYGDVDPAAVDAVYEKPEKEGARAVTPEDRKLLVEFHRKERALWIDKQDKKEQKKADKAEDAKE